MSCCKSYVSQIIREFCEEEKEGVNHKEEGEGVTKGAIGSF